MARRTSFGLVSGLTLLVACTAGASTVSTSTVPIQTGSGTTSVPTGAIPARAADLPGMLLVRTEAGGLMTLAPDGTEATILVDPSSQAITVSQATWSPDGERVAWSQVDASGGIPRSDLVVADAAGGTPLGTALPVVPFYLAWDPTSARVAFLGGTRPFTLGLVEREGGGPATELGTGTPFYFSWAPDGERLVAHVGLEGLHELRIDGTRATALDRTGLLQAPVWTPDGASILYAKPSGPTGIGEVVARDVGSDRVRAVAELDGQAFLVLSPDGAQLAYHARAADELDFYDRTLPDRATDLGVRVADLERGEVVAASRDPAIQWSWSPDGRRLAILEPRYVGSQITFRWRVWSADGSSFTTAPFVGSLLLLQEANFFTQFAQSASMWAPDSSAFAYPAMTDAGTRIFIQPSEAGALPFEVGAGDWVAWSSGP